jgi:hypothetical protein
MIILTAIVQNSLSADYATLFNPKLLLPFSFQVTRTSIGSTPVRPSFGLKSTAYMNGTTQLQPCGTRSRVQASKLIRLDVRTVPPAIVPTAKKSHSSRNFVVGTSLYVVGFFRNRELNMYHVARLHANPVLAFQLENFGGNISLHCHLNLCPVIRVKTKIQSLCTLRSYKEGFLERKPGPPI